MTVASGSCGASATSPVEKARERGGFGQEILGEPAAGIAPEGQIDPGLEPADAKGERDREPRREPEAEPASRHGAAAPA